MISCHIVMHESQMLRAKFDRNSLTVFKVIVRKLLAYFYVDTAHISNFFSLIQVEPQK